MDNLMRLKRRTGETDEALLEDMLFSAKIAILNRRYPYKQFSYANAENTELEGQYEDLQFRMALDLYNKQGAEGQITHNSNGTNRMYESSWISAQLLAEVTPYCGVTG